MVENGEEQREKPKKSAGKKRAEPSIELSTARLKKMITKVMDNLEYDDNPTKTSVGELLKLLQVYKDLAAEQVKEVEVRWVDRLRVDEESET